MGTTVTLNASNASKVDVVEDYTKNEVNMVCSYTSLKLGYTNKLTKEKEQLAASTSRLNIQTTSNNANIIINNARSSEIDDILSVVNNL